MTQQRLAALLAIAVIAGYSTVAWAVGSFYPFSVFPMYAHRTGYSRAARVVARRSSGELVEVTEYRAFACEGTLDPREFERVCGQREVYAPQYLDDELTHHVRAGAAEVEHGERIEIVRHVWTLAPAGSVSGSDCVLARCTASR